MIVNLRNIIQGGGGGVLGKGNRNTIPKLFAGVNMVESGGKHEWYRDLL